MFGEIRVRNSVAILTFLILTKCSIQNFDTPKNFPGSMCPKPTAADSYATIKNYNLTAGNVSPFTSNYTYNGTDGITPNNTAIRLVNTQLISNINYGVTTGCGPYTGVQVTLTFKWGAGVQGAQYVSFGRYAAADFNADAVSDTARTYLKITPTVASTGVQAVRDAQISAGSTGSDGPASVVCSTNLGANTTTTTDQTIVFQFEQISHYGARHRYSDGTNTFSSSDSGNYMGSGCGDGTAAGIYVAGKKVVGLESIFSSSTTTAPALMLDTGPATATVADRPVIKTIKIETRKVYPDFSGGTF